MCSVNGRPGCARCVSDNSARARATIASLPVSSGCSSSKICGVPRHAFATGEGGRHRRRGAGGHRRSGAAGCAARPHRPERARRSASCRAGWRCARRARSLRPACSCGCEDRTVLAVRARYRDATSSAYSVSAASAPSGLGAGGALGSPGISAGASSSVRLERGMARILTPASGVASSRKSASCNVVAVHARRPNETHEST